MLASSLCKFWDVLEGEKLPLLMFTNYLSVERWRDFVMIQHGAYVEIIEWLSSLGSLL